MSRIIIRLGTAVAVATAACAGTANAQFDRHQRGGGAPAAPHISAPAAPRISAPAAPHVSAPAARFSAPAAPHVNVAPQIRAAPQINAGPRFSAAPHAATPRFNAPSTTRLGNARAFTPRSGGFAARNLSRPTFRGPSVTRHALRGPSVTRSLDRGAARSLARGTSVGRFAGRNISRQALRSSGGLTRGATQTRTAMPSPARTNTRTTIGTAANRAFQPTARSNQIAAFRAPLGARNVNFADRTRFFADRRRFFHHGGFIGWFGPVFWPYAYDDVFDYAFWPSEYDDYGFWAYAYDDVLDSALWAPDLGNVYAYASGGGYAGGGGRRARAHAPSIDDASRAATQICQASDPGLTQWPIEQIEQTVQPTANQQKLLGGLKAASERAARLLQAACPASQPSTPLGRLDAITERLDTLLEAIDIVRPALANFYDSLTDEQKARFNAIGQQQTRSARRGNAASSKSEARLCGGQAPAVITQRSIRRIEQDVRPSGQQRDALDRLRDASAKAADLLRDACPEQTPLTPVARLDAMAKRVHAMLDAAKTVRPALARFYSSLSDEQKAHFNIMRPRQG